MRILQLTISKTPANFLSSCPREFVPGITLLVYAIFNSRHNKLRDGQKRECRIIKASLVSYVAEN